MSTAVNPTIFREYDVRGIVDRDLTPGVVEALGRGFGTYLVRKGRRDLALGRDVRESSNRFRDAMLKGLTSAGCFVTDVGVCPTPLLYFALHHLQKQGGVMITGSHNPPEFNGFKLCSGTATIWGEEIQNVRRLVEAGDFQTDGAGQVSTEAIIAPYISYVANDIRLERRIRVVADAGNGTAGIVGPDLLREIGAEVIELYCDPDPTFPHHHPDPTIPENLKDLIAKVKETGAELGIGWDGDGDRIGVVDRNGGILWGDQLLILFAREILKERPGATIVGEVKCSKNLYDDVARHGGNAVMWKAGHSLIKAKMKELGAVLGGEMSGHLFFADRWFGFDDALYASARLLEILSRGSRGVEELLADLPKTFSTPEIRVDCPDDQKFAVVERVTEHFRARNEVVDVDGVRVVFEDGWGLVRASNTQPVLVLRFEADSQARLDEIRKLVEDVVRKMKA